MNANNELNLSIDHLIKFDDKANETVFQSFLNAADNRYKPDQTFNRFLGTNSSGEWKLKISDQNFNDEGQLLSGH